MASVHVIGQRRQIVGFVGVGARPVAVHSSAEALDAVRRLVRDEDAALVLVVESAIEDVAQEFEAVRRASVKPVLVIPDHHGSRGVMLALMRKEIEQSLGVDLLKD